jgi:hypothetical protein
MSKRLQVLMDDEELAKVQSAAEHEGATVAEWVRRALKRALQERPERARDRKIAAVRSATGHAFPAPDIEEMLAEIDRGRSAELP